MPGNPPKFPMVRCPKCGHLLPEHSRYAVYRCGGCNSVLKAEKESSVNDDQLEKSRGGRVVGVDLRAPGRVSKSPMRPRYGDADRKYPLRGRMSADFDDRSRSTDGDDRRSPLRRPPPANELVLPTESFNGWLPGAEATDQDQTDVNKSNRSPRKRRTWNKEDPSIGFGPKQIPEQVVGEEYKEQVDVSFDAWVEEDGYGGRRRNAELRVQGGYVEVYEKPRGRMEHRQRVPIHPYDQAPLNHPSRSHYNNVAMKQAELLRKYNELGEELHKIGDLSYNQGGRGDFYDDPDDYVHDGYLRGRRELYEEDMKNYHPSRYMPNGVPFHDDPLSPRTSRRTTNLEPHYYHQQFAHRRPMDPIYDPRTENADVYDYKRHPGYPNAYGKRIVDSTIRNPTPNNLSSNSRTSVGTKSDGSSSFHDRAKRVLVVGKNQQLCHPVAGGAPFVTCSNCCQLLRLPGKLRTMKKKQYRLQCGSCRTILSFDFDKKRSHDVPSEAVSKSTHDKSIPGSTHSESYDLKSTGDTFPNSDSERSSELEDRRLSTSEAKLRPVLSPSSSNASKDDKLSEAVGQTDASSSKGEKPLTNDMRPLRPPPGSPLRYHLDYSDILAGMESGEDKGTVERDSSPRNYVESAAVQTDASIRKDQRGPSLPETYVSPAELDVFVNGQPINLVALRRAEKMAGPIKPGEYWYDSKAGFWGLKGGHCLGIIAPSIEEFRAPMPENCSGGDTCIYVNGRELHKNDLDLLSSRRLPRTRYKYYRIDISGKVVDEDTGRFVVNLGKLAPNVERTGRGFGMQPPDIQNY